MKLVTMVSPDSSYILKKLIVSSTMTEAQEVLRSGWVGNPGRSLSKRSEAVRGNKEMRCYK